MFVNSPLKYYALNEVNKLMQRYKAWIMYSNDNKTI